MPRNKKKSFCFCFKQKFWIQCHKRVLTKIGYHWRDCKHAHYQSQKLSYWISELQCWYIDNYHIAFLPFSPVEERNSENIDSIQFDTIYQWYLFEISQNYIITCFSSQFVLDLCTQNNIKPIILYSKWYITEYFFYQTGANLRFCVKIKVKLIFLI